METTKTSGISASTFFQVTILTLFIGLKLGHVIDWSWVWVLSPLWVSIALELLFLTLVIGVETYKTHKLNVARKANVNRRRA